MADLLYKCDCEDCDGIRKGSIVFQSPTGHGWFQETYCICENCKSCANNIGRIAFLWDFERDHPGVSRNPSAEELEARRIVKIKELKAEIETLKAEKEALKKQSPSEEWINLKTEVDNLKREVERNNPPQLYNKSHDNGLTYLDRVELNRCGMCGKSPCNCDYLR